MAWRHGSEPSGQEISDRDPHSVQPVAVFEFDEAANATGDDPYDPVQEDPIGEIGIHPREAAGTGA